MKSLLFLFLYLVFPTINYAQTSSPDDLKELSKDFQRIFREKGWTMHSPLALEGLVFTEGPVFYRFKDRVRWIKRGKEELPLHFFDSLIIATSTIKDSIAYQLLGVYSEQTKTQIVDIYRYGHLRDFENPGFPNPGLYGTFAHGIDNFNTSLASHLDSTLHMLVQDTTIVQLCFSAIKPYSCMAITSSNPGMQDVVTSWFLNTKRKYEPAFRLGRLMNSYCVFKVVHKDVGFNVKRIDYGESFYCLDSPDVLYFFEPLYRGSASKAKMTFVYDEKWTEEEFLASSNIRAIRDRIKTPLLLEALKDFRTKGSVKAFSNIYSLQVLLK